MIQHVRESSNYIQPVNLYHRVDFGVWEAKLGSKTSNNTKPENIRLYILVALTIVLILKHVKKTLNYVTELWDSANDIMMLNGLPSK